MRDSLRVLTVSGALVLAVAFAPAMAQTGSAPQESGTSATPRIGINGSLLPGAPAPAQESNADAGVSPSKDSDAAKDSDAVKDSGAAKDSNTATDPSAPQFDHGAGTAAGEPAAAIPSADKKKALSILRRSTRDYELCKRSCFAYFDSFGVAFNFADGTIAAYAHEQRGKISGHDCVVNARNALARGDRSLAAQWMMAAQADILNRNWIADHPDAMLEALRTFRGWA
jgi:hypothetical protein